MTMPLSRGLAAGIDGYRDFVAFIPPSAPVQFDLGTESIPVVKLRDSNGVSISRIFDDGDFITLYSDACSYR